MYHQKMCLFVFNKGCQELTKPCPEIRSKHPQLPSPKLLPKSRKQLTNHDVKLSY